MSDQTVQAIRDRLEQDKYWRERSEKQLRDTVSMLCHFVWHRVTRSGEHMWSIPVDHERDFDCILSDAITELLALREAVTQHAAEAQALRDNVAALDKIQRENAELAATWAGRALKAEAEGQALREERDALKAEIAGLLGSAGPEDAPQ